VLLLRYTGIRIGDAVSLTSDRIKLNRLFLYTAKTGTPVNTVLPEFVLETVEACPKVTGMHFFWNGTGKLDTIVGSWRRRLENCSTLLKCQTAMHIASVTLSQSNYYSQACQSRESRSYSGTRACE
jgi:hypothetical protein